MNAIEPIDIDAEVISDLSDNDTSSFGQTSSRKRSRICKERCDYDDGNLAFYLERIKNVEQLKHNDDDLIIDEQLRIPVNLWKMLYEYQKDGIRWLYSLHQQECGGILGDEMGLGKTIQIIVFLTSLLYSDLPNDHLRYSGLGPVLIITPTTLLFQWVQEFHQWAPTFRVSVFHSLGAYAGKKKDLLLNCVTKTGNIILTSYGTLLEQIDLLTDVRWHYVILDEGHRIRNPEAQIAVACKLFNTPHRIILSGTPIQNNLRELWSLFDFVFPGKLGTLEAFTDSFAVPINAGGYSNADKVEVQTAQKCASYLLDIIKPYLLCRTKSQTQQCLDLPAKSEQVLFCKLTDTQRSLYQEFISSKKCRDILFNHNKIFAGIQYLRNLCNHPSLVSNSFTSDYKLSGKMTVIKTLLKLWFEQKRKVLLYVQGRKILDIIEELVKNRKYNYLRIDGTTPLLHRQALIRKFHEDPSIFIFLLTTRVGGVGVNLTGANRVIIFDPDWNPSVDLQARERVWRIGQDKEVAIYRLITASTIEEKIYHRQIYKQFLTKRVLQNSKQKRFFHFANLHSLFSLEDDTLENKTETEKLFASAGCKVLNKAKHIKKDLNLNGDSSFANDSTFINDSDSYILAKLLKTKTVQCAFAEDALNGAAVNESTWIEKEASLLAMESMRKLNASRSYCFNATSGLPNYGEVDSLRWKRNKRKQSSTYTKQLVVNQQNELLSSSELLSRIQNSQNEHIDIDNLPLNTQPCNTLKADLIDVLTKNSNFGISSDNIISLFHYKITNRRVFKLILRQVADLKPIGRSGTSYRWFLKKHLH
ncbi:hypothetical protein GJ496_002150 [Pomphorhynchus laevis]|nr:hypothetical protein GJ496_002150 [Pomphorhynchus laevis]